MAEKTKVLFLIDSLGGGGAEKVLVTLLRHIDKSRFDITLCQITDTGGYTDEARQYVRCEEIQSHYPHGGTALSKFLWKVKYKLVKNWLPLSLVYRLWVPKGNDVEVAFVEGLTTKLLSKAPSHSRKLAWVHTDLENNHWTTSIFKNPSAEAKAYRRFDKVIGVSKTATEAVNRLFGGDLPTETIYNPIDTDEVKRKAAEPVADIPTKKPGTVRICSTGRLVPQKGFDRLIRIAKRLKDDGRQIELWLLGQGELRPELEELIEQNGLQDTVTLWGFKANPYAYMAACDLFVCSSLAEGYNLALAEAIIIGLPVISVKCTGPCEILESTKAGILTENSESSLYDGIYKFLNNPKPNLPFTTKTDIIGIENIKRIESLLDESDNLL